MQTINNYIMDMDGVLVSGARMIPGANKFIERLQKQGKKYLLLTNNSLYTPTDLAHRLQVTGLEIQAECIFTSALATANFLKSQLPNGTAYVIGESGLTEAIHEVGYVITDLNPTYVVLGETHSYQYDRITRAVRLIESGAQFIATNPDVSGPSEHGTVPGCGAMAALIEKATGKAPFFVGKPNPLMMRSALNFLDAHSEESVMVGDRMDTDIIGGIESGMQTILVLSGVTARPEVENYPYRPTRIVESVAEIKV